MSKPAPKPQAPSLRTVAAVGLSGAGLMGAGLLGRWLAGRRLRSVEQLRNAWERLALEVGDVGLAEGLDLSFIDQLPVGAGQPDDLGPSLGASLGAGEADEPAPHEVLNLLTDPRFAPIDRGAPHASVPSSSTWPVLTTHPSRLTVSYWTAEGPRGYSGRAFAAKRVDRAAGELFERKHAGVDLFADAGDVVVAPEDGHVLAILPFHAGTWAVYLRSPLGDRVVNLGEVEAQSWREFGVRPGQLVPEGQPLARVGVQDEGSTMLHVEIYGVGEGVVDEGVVEQIRAGGMRWVQGKPPAAVRDPSGYLLVAARRCFLRAGLG